MNTGYYEAIEIKHGVADDMEIKQLKVDSIVVKDDALKLDMTGRRIKELYESEKTQTLTQTQKKNIFKNSWGKTHQRWEGWSFRGTATE